MQTTFALSYKSCQIFAANVRYIRVSRKLSVAKMDCMLRTTGCRVHLNTLKNLIYHSERIRDVRLSTVCKFAKCFGIPIDLLLTIDIQASKKTLQDAIKIHKLKQAEYEEFKRDIY